MPTNPNPGEGKVCPTCGTSNPKVRDYLWNPGDSVADFKCCTDDFHTPPQPDQPDTVSEVERARRDYRAAFESGYYGRLAGAAEALIAAEVAAAKREAEDAIDKSCGCTFTYPDGLKQNSECMYHANQRAEAKREAVSGMHIWRCLCAREDDAWPGHVDPRCIAARKEAAK